MTFPYKEILSEIDRALTDSNFDDGLIFVNKILNSRHSLTLGAGRVGLVMRGFAKRLRHLGLSSFDLLDSTIPRTQRGDILIVGSGSGSTPSVLSLVEVAHKNNLEILLITATPNSPMSGFATTQLLVNAPTKNNEGDLISLQPMTTLFEQSIGILLDSIVLHIMHNLGETSETMRERHNVIE